MPRRSSLILPVLVLLGLLVLGGTTQIERSPTESQASGNRSRLGLPPLDPANQDVDPLRVRLGHKLFFDRRLSFNGTMSCAMCHVPEEGFTSQASQLSMGLEGKSLRRNAPTVLNVAWQQKLFHDGREPSLTALAWSPLMNPDEMGNPSPGHLLARLRQWPDYAGLFEQAFAGQGPSMDTVGAAMAAYMRTLVAGDSRFDRWRYGKDLQALTAQEQQGFRVFSGPGRCSACHTVGEKDALFSDGLFHVTGAGLADTARSLAVTLAPGVNTVLSGEDLVHFSDTRSPDLGRFDITLQEVDRFAFKTPSLRNVAHTAPYMHDGSLPTLEAVVAFYNQGGGRVVGKSPLIAPLGLTPADEMALVAFLRSLDGSRIGELSNAARSPP